MSHRFFSALVLGFFACFLAAAGVVNFLVNPYAQYPTRWLSPLVQASRAAKVELLRQMQPSPDGLVLGSSRVLKLEPGYLQDKLGVRFFNAGVNYGKSEDHLALLHFYHELVGSAPRVVILGLDVHGFSPALPIDARLLGQHELVGHLGNSIPLADRLQPWRELVSWQQLAASVRCLRHHVQRPAMQPASESYRPDGLLVYHERERQMRRGTYDLRAALEYNKREYRSLFAGYERISPRRWQHFLQLVDFCAQHQVQLYVFLTPLHPELEAYLCQTTNYAGRREELQEKLQQAAVGGRFAFRDFSDIRSFAGCREQFVDGIHPLEQNTRRLVDRLLTPSPSADKYAVQ